MKKISPVTASIVKILNDGQYHDGTTIGSALNITRAAVWKAIKKLGSYGINIDSIKGKGYSLLEPLILLNGEFIKENIHQQNIDIHTFESIPSTNEFLKSIKPKQKNIQICLAEQQTAGKGRFERKWHSPFAQNIYLSCAYPFHIDVSQLAGLSLIVSLAVLKTIATYALPKPLQVKWPNDILYDHKKISGSLIELQAESHGHCHAIIGIGININMLYDDDKITQAWTSLRQVTATYIDRNEFCVLLINHLLEYLDKFATSHLNYFLAEWRDVDYLFNQTISIKSNNNIIKGKSSGIDQHGNLIMQLENGESVTVSSGEASILKGGRA